MHLHNGLPVIGRDALQGLDGHRLGGYLIVEPRVAGTRRVVVAAHLLAIDGVLLQALHVLTGLGAVALLQQGRLSQDHGRHRLLVDGLALDVLLHQVEQIGVGFLHV